MNLIMNIRCMRFRERSAAAELPGSRENNAARYALPGTGCMKGCRIKPGLPLRRLFFMICRHVMPRKPQSAAGNQRVRICLKTDFIKADKLIPDTISIQAGDFGYVAEKSVCCYPSVKKSGGNLKSNLGSILNNYASLHRI